MTSKRSLFPRYRNTRWRLTSFISTPFDRIRTAHALQFVCPTTYGSPVFDQCLLLSEYWSINATGGPLAVKNTRTHCLFGMFNNNSLQFVHRRCTVKRLNPLGTDPLIDYQPRYISAHERICLHSANEAIHAAGIP